MFAYAAIALPFLLWLILRFTLPPGPYNMDPCGKGTFFPHLILYSTFAYAQVTLGVFGATWAFSHGAKEQAGLLLFAAAYALLFAGYLAFCYESWMASMAQPPTVNLPGKSNYTLAKYAVVLSLGFSSIALLIVGAAWTAVEVGK